MNDTLLKSYNRSFNGGKSRFARICDNMFSALLLTAALYLLVSRKLHHGAASLFAAMLISASILLTASLLRSLRFNAHIKKLRRETSESILRRRILVSPEVDEVIRSLHRSSSEYPNQAYSEQSATRSFYLLRTEKAITFDDILPIIREARIITKSMALRLQAFTMMIRLIQQLPLTTITNYIMMIRSLQFFHQ